MFFKKGSGLKLTHGTLCFCRGALCKVSIQIYVFLKEVPLTRGKLPVDPGSNPTSDRSIVCGLGFLPLPDYMGFPPFGVFFPHLKLNISSRIHSVMALIVLSGMSRINKNTNFEPHTDLMFVSQLFHVLMCMSGTILSWPSSTALMAFAAMSVQSTYHCGLSRGSTISLERLEWRPYKLPLCHIDDEVHMYLLVRMNIQYISLGLSIPCK